MHEFVEDDVLIDLVREHMNAGPACEFRQSLEISRAEHGTTGIVR
jgi:hypothetical protein